MIRKINFALLGLFLLSYFTPFYVYSSNINGHHIKQVRYGIQLITDFPLQFLIAILPVILYVSQRKRWTKELRLFLVGSGFVYLSWVIFSTNIFNIPWQIFINFIQQQMSYTGFGFYLNLILGLLTFAVACLRKG
ncbi:hypothetical protein [Lactococcus kimchii]|uniref:hypothetical protein n=1 Tax=Lactococcus sp. S-13 TaxID=2507158 RepID=UPI001023F222|nr:hypothetical protein [Lactococcus sp. S-13]RZI49180.1 hypothetical protein EQJ87_06855 [Lactococcus sp. S-13]